MCLSVNFYKFSTTTPDTPNRQIDYISEIENQPIFTNNLTPINDEKITSYCTNRLADWMQNKRLYKRRNTR